MNAYPKETAGVLLSWFGILFLVPVASATDWFRDDTAKAGLDFVHTNGMGGDYYLPEITGPGGALFDYDNDGDLDVFLLQGHPLDTYPANPDPAVYRDRLYRNDLTIGADGSPRLSLKEVTGESGILGTGYGMGVATGDYDNDGWTDLYVTNWGSNRLWRNDGDGTFTDVTQATGTGGEEWSTSAAFFDYDRDGCLDLFVANYLWLDARRNKACYISTSARDYCGPQVFQPQTDRLYRNRCDGGFDPVPLSGTPAAPGLGVVSADFNGDGWPDIYVANDRHENHLWLNQEGRGFVETALLNGAAVNLEGGKEAGMGVDAADIDDDGDEDILVVHLRGETNTLYLNRGDATFDDVTAVAGLGSGSLPFTSFGTAWLDYDNDSRLDLFIANGEVRMLSALAEAGDPYPYRQHNQLFSNEGQGRFEEVTARAGEAFSWSEISRGAALGDLDNDGDTDILVVNVNAPARLLMNQLGNRQAWIGLQVLDRHGRDALGSRVAFSLSDGRTVWRRVHSDGSYCSANDPRILLGLPAGVRIEQVAVHPQNGPPRVLSGLAERRYQVLRTRGG